MTALKKTSMEYVLDDGDITLQILIHTKVRHKSPWPCIELWNLNSQLYPICLLELLNYGVTFRKYGNTPEK